MTTPLHRLVGTPLMALLIASAAPAHADDSLYQALGQRDGLARLMDDFVPRLFSDPRLKPFFKDTNAKHLQTQLTMQLCEVSGGPCRYDGPDMKAAHQDMGVDRAAFNALVDVLQQAMDAQGLPFGTQNRLLARLAPMHRDIVTRP